MSSGTESGFDLSVPDGVRTIASDEEAVAAAAAYADAIRVDAVARDAEQRLPHDELRSLARTGLLGMRVPRAFGGAEVSSATVAEVFRLIAVADPAVAQIPQNHVAFVETIVRYGSSEQRAFFLAEFLRGARLGNALSERGGPTSRDWVTRIVRQPDGWWRLNGRKYYSTGALTAQWVPVFARDEHERIVVAYVPRETPGLRVDQDWDAFGQRATFSGTTVLEDVRVDPLWVVEEAFGGSEESTTSAAFAQLVHVAIDVGIARGALDDGVQFLRSRARPWFEAGVERAADDPHLVRLVGELDAQVRAAEALLASAAAAVDVADGLGAADVGADRAGPPIGAATDGTSATGGAGAADPGAITEARLAVAAAKAFGGETALRVSSELFDLSGASAADRKHGLDRHWRNARTHTLHDPARSKHVHLGRWLIDGIAPPPGHPLV